MKKKEKLETTATKDDVGKHGGVVFPEMYCNNPVLLQGTGSSSNSLVLLKRATAKDIFGVVSSRIYALGMIAHFMSSSRRSAAPPVATAPATEKKANNTSSGPRVVPLPPDLPTTWPPNFIYDAEKPTASSSSDMTLASRVNVAVQPAGPKTKRVYWDAMQDITSTLWGDDVSALLPDPGRIFGDIKEVFSVTVAPVKTAKASAAIGVTRAKMLLGKKKQKFILRETCREDGLL